MIRAALDALRAEGTEPVAALFLGGTEKVDGYGAAVDLGIPSEWAPAGMDADLGLARAVLGDLLARYAVDVVVDRSDEPVLDARARLRLASVVLAAGVPYEGADFTFSPPPRSARSARPSIAVIGTGKRTGKTAISGAVTRALAGLGRTPVVLAMGRGGPPDPVVVPAGTPIGPDTLLAVADEGGHAASDFYEGALMTGAATVGARRCGGGLAGAVGYANVERALREVDALPGDVTLLEGSGAAIPPAHADATVLVVPGDADPAQLHGYLGPYRILLADLVVVTMAEPPRSSAVSVEAVLEAIRSISRDLPVLRTVFRPEPLAPVAGTKVFFATTAPDAVSAVIAGSLQSRFGCEVVATSSHLADRPALRAALEAAPAFEVLLVELKAAAVDVAVRFATQVGARVVFCDNRPVVVGGAGLRPGDPDPDLELRAAVARLAGLADERFAAR